MLPQKCRTEDKFYWTCKLETGLQEIIAEKKCAITKKLPYFDLGVDDSGYKTKKKNIIYE